MAHGDAREEKWRGKCGMHWVASTLHTTSEYGVSSITTADVHNSTASSQLKWRPPVDLNVLDRLAAKMKSRFCDVPSHFKSSLLPADDRELRRGSQHMCTAVCRQLVRCASWTCDPEVEGTIFFWKVKSPGLFTRWQTKRHISRDSHCHLPTTMEFQNCKFITSPTSQTFQIYPWLCAWHLGKGESRGIDLVTLSFCTCWQWVVSFTPQPL